MCLSKLDIINLCYKTLNNSRLFYTFTNGSSLSLCKLKV